MNLEAERFSNETQIRQRQQDASNFKAFQRENDFNRLIRLINEAMKEDKKSE